MFNAIQVLARALSVGRLRVNTLASNLANAETTRTPEGGPYKRKDIVQMALPVPGTFHSALDRMSLASPQVSAVVEDGEKPRLVYKPGHPDANKDGYVAYPNINIVSTMTDLMSASRMYQATGTATETATRMEQEALRISVRS